MAWPCDNPKLYLMLFPCQYISLNFEYRRIFSVAIWSLVPEPITFEAEIAIESWKVASQNH
jgi:hypothetical protein